MKCKGIAATDEFSPTAVRPHQPETFSCTCNEAKTAKLNSSQQKEFVGCKKKKNEVITASVHEY